MARYYVQVDGSEIGLEVSHAEGRTMIRPLSDGQPDGEIDVDFATVHADPASGEGLYSLLAGGKSYQVYVERVDEGLRMVMWRHRFELTVLSEREWRLMKVAPRQGQVGGQVTVKAPMPGLVKSVSVNEGDQVASGERLVVLEAMKMENEILA